MASPVCWMRAAPSSAALCVGVFEDAASFSMAFSLVMLRCVAMPAATTRFKKESRHKKEKKQKNSETLGTFSRSFSRSQSVYIVRKKQ
uniref:Putative secreted protein n=1 Tax=Ixodes ricinus TaxID=34613 RepID=A0A6B0TZX7_IXORI